LLFQILNLCRYIQGGLPPIVEVKGRLADGSEWSNRIQVVDDLSNNVMDVPLDKVFIKQRIDLLTAKAWLQREKVLEAGLDFFTLFCSQTPTDDSQYCSM
jgi:hypothetical protein